MGNRQREADTLDSLGYIHQHLGHSVEAISLYQQAIDLWHALDDYYSRAKSLTRLGTVYHDVHNYAGATAAWEEAFAILHQLAHPEAHDVRTKLIALNPDPNPTVRNTGATPGQPA